MSGCIWRGSLEPRGIKARHIDTCRDGGCKGCLPCPADHCVVCGIEHVEQQTCPTCIAATREDVSELRDLYATLPAHRISGGNDGMLEAGRDIPGGEAAAMLAPGSDGRAVPWARERGDDVSHIADEWAAELAPPLMALVSWQEDWMSTLGTNVPDEAATLNDAAAFLLDRLSWAAQRHDAFDAFATEMRQQRAHIEDVLHTGERPTLGAPCEVCNKPLERIMAATQDNDRWWCDRCKKSLGLGEYVERVSKVARKHKGWLTSRDMAEEHRIPRGSLTAWASLGDVRKRLDMNLGRQVYNVKDALKKRDDTAKPDDCVTDRHMIR